jgi:2'-5' RNA ligase
VKFRHLRTSAVGPHRYDEALDSSQKKEVDTWEKGKHEFSDHAFGGPIDTHHTVSIPLPKTPPKPPEELVQHLSKHDLEVHDYAKGLAKKKGDTRPIRIGRALHRTGAPESLKRTYENDPNRTGSGSMDGHHIVITRHPHHVAAMSTGTHWKSCMTMGGQGEEEGSESHHLESDIKYGTHVAYLVHKNDTNIERPLGRVAIKPFVNSDGKRALRPEGKPHGDLPDGFHSAVKGWTKKHFPLEAGKVYSKHGALYDDDEKPHIFKGRKDPRLTHSDPYERLRALPNASKADLHDLATTETHPTVLHALVRKDSLSHKTLHHLHDHADPAVRNGVTRHRNTRRSTVHAMIGKETNIYNIRALASHPSVGSKHLEALSTHDDHEVRASVAEHGNTPVRILSKLAKDPDQRVASGVVRNPRVTPDHLHTASNHPDPNVHWAISGHPSTRGDTLHKIATKGPGPSTAENVARHQNTLPKTLEHLSEHPLRGVRRGVALHGSTPHHVLDRLAGDPSAEVVEAVARNESTHPDTLDRLAETRHHAHVVINNSTSSETLHRIATNPQRHHAHWRIAQHVNASEKTLEHLSGHPESFVRGEVATHPNTPAHVHQKLMNDSEASVRNAASEHPIFGKEKDESTRGLRFRPLEETFINIMPHHTELRQKMFPKIHQMLKTAYEPVGGLAGGGLSSVEDMHNSIPMVKVHRQGGEIRAVTLYKDKQGRKAVAAATDGSPEGRKGLERMRKEDMLRQRTWGEVSSRMLSYVKRKIKITDHAIHPDEVKKLYSNERIDHPVPDDDPEVVRHPELKDYFYRREIGGQMKTKIAIGTPNKKFDWSGVTGGKKKKIVDSYEGLFDDLIFESTSFEADWEEDLDEATIPIIRGALAMAKRETGDHPHKGKDFHMTGRDLPASYHGGPVQVRNVDPQKLDPQGRGSKYGRGFYTTTSEFLARRREGTTRTWQRRDTGTVTVKKASPKANILVAHELEGHESNGSLRDEVYAHNPKYKKTGDMGMGDHTWVNQVNKFAEHHKYDAVAWKFKHPEGYPEHGQLNIVWKNHDRDTLVHINRSAARKAGFLKEEETHLYHVTHTHHVEGIKKDGLKPMQTSNWVKAADSSRYGGGKVHAFEHYHDAVRWAGKMDWQFNKGMGTGKVSIVKFKHDGGDWEEDHSDPIAQADKKGRWLKRTASVKPEHVLDAHPITVEHIRKALSEREFEKAPPIRESIDFDLPLEEWITGRRDTEMPCHLPRTDPEDHKDTHVRVTSDVGYADYRHCPKHKVTYVNMVGNSTPKDGWRRQRKGPHSMGGALLLYHIIREANKREHTIVANIVNPDLRAGADKHGAKEFRDEPNHPLAKHYHQLDIFIPHRKRPEVGGKTVGEAFRRLESMLAESRLDEKAGPFKYCSTQVNLTGEDAKVFGRMNKAVIPDSLLAGDGRETDPHVTVKYGLHKSDPDLLARVVSGFGPAKLTFGKLKHFPANKSRPESDVVVVEVESKDLVKLNKMVADAFPHTDTYPTYNPHMTLAYVKVGEGKAYEGKNHPLKGKSVNFDVVHISDKEGGKTPVSLTDTKVDESEETLNTTLLVLETTADLDLDLTEEVTSTVTKHRGCKFNPGSPYNDHKDEVETLSGPTGDADLIHCPRHKITYVDLVIDREAGSFRAQRPSERSTSNAAMLHHIYHRAKGRNHTIVAQVVNDDLRDRMDKIGAKKLRPGSKIHDLVSRSTYSGSASYDPRYRVISPYAIERKRKIAKGKAEFRKRQMTLGITASRHRTPGGRNAVTVTKASLGEAMRKLEATLLRESDSTHKHDVRHPAHPLHPFQKLADLQRDKPESAMLKIQGSQISQIYGHAAEHIGDLTHRMADKPDFMKGGYEMVKEKVNKMHRTLHHDYGFEKEAIEQVHNNHEYHTSKGIETSYGATPEHGIAKLKELGKAYADEHRALPTFNHAQRTAQAAAIALGEFRFDDVRKHLTTLKSWVDQGHQFWSDKAMHDPKKKA